MKTTKLMTAFALSAVFAACSQDADLNEAIVKNDFSDVPMVEANFTANFGAESRMANQYGLELNDIVGFAWMGKTNKNGAAWANYPLYCTDPTTGAFEGESMYYVGDYFAYMPYSEETVDVANIPFSVKGQVLSSNQADYAKYAVKISTKKVTLSTEADAENKAGRGQNIALNLSDLSNDALINLVFDNADEIADLEVKNVSVSLKTSAGAEILPLSFTYKPYDGDKTSWADVETSSFIEKNMQEFTYGPLELTNEEGLAVENGELNTYAVLFPAHTGNLDGATITVTVTTNYGVVTADKVTIKDAKATKYNALSKTTPLFSKFAQRGTIKAELDMEKAVMSNISVTSQEELNEVLDKLVAINEKDPVTISLKKSAAPAAAFTLDNFELPEDLNAVVTFTAGSNITGINFTGETTIDKQIYFGTPVTVSGTMIVENIEGKNTIATKGAEMITISNGAVLYNNGTIVANIETLAANEAKGLSFGKYINNSETANLKEATIKNNGEAQWIAGKLPKVASKTNNVYAEALNVEDIEKANIAKVKTIRLMPGTYIANAAENYDWSSVKEYEVYGSANIDLTASAKEGKTLNMPGKVTVKKEATLTINSNSKKNNLNVGTITVEEGAWLNIYNLSSSVGVNNYGYGFVSASPNVVEFVHGENATWVTNK